MMSDLVDLLSQAWGRWRELVPGKWARKSRQEEPVQVPEVVLAELPLEVQAASQVQHLNALLLASEPDNATLPPLPDHNPPLALQALRPSTYFNHTSETDFAWASSTDAAAGWGLTTSVLIDRSDDLMHVVALESGVVDASGATGAASTAASATASSAAAASSASSSTLSNQWSHAFQVVDRVPGSSVLLGGAGVAAAGTVLHSSSTAAADTTPPTVSLLSSTSSLKAGQTATVTFVLSESSTTFKSSSVTVTGGTLSNFSGSGVLYSATFTPTANSTTAGSVSVSSGKFSDAVGNQNADGADANNRVDFAIDTAAPVAPLARLDGSWAVNPQVTMQVNMGSGALQNVVVEVFPNEVGATVSNWLGYVNSGFYNGLIFHRVIPGFVAQGGGFTTDLTQKTVTYDALALESGVHGLTNAATTIAMARSTAPDSATSQFYFNLVDNTSLDYSNASSPGYAVFGEVVSGWSTIQAIGNVTTSTQNGMANVPTSAVTTQNASMTQTGQAYSSSGIIHLSGLEPGAQWSYSLDGGNAWTTFTQTDLNVGTTPGNKTVSIRQTDSAGNVSATSSVSFTQYTPDDLHSVLDLATASDTAGGAAGTDQDNITQATSLDLSATLAAWANREVWLMDQGRYVATATANGSGALSWLSVNASAGTHVYTLYDPAEHVRVLATGGVAVSELTVRVL